MRVLKQFSIDQFQRDHCYSTFGQVLVTTERLMGIKQHQHMHDGCPGDDDDDSTDDDDALHALQPALAEALKSVTNFT